MCKDITIFPMLLSEFETEYMPILNALTDPSIIIDGKMPGKIVLSNKSAEQLFLYTEQELSKINLINLLTEKSREMYLKDLELYQKNSITIKFNDVKHDYYGKKKNGEEFLLDLSLSQIMIDNKMYLLTVLRDLSKLKLSEELSASKSTELVVQQTILNCEKQYLNQQENFVNALCHELCNPITGIYSGVQTLKDSLELLQQASLSIEEQQILFQDIGIKLEMIAKCVEQEKRIVDDVLTVSKLENGTESLNLIAFELTEVIGNVSKMFLTQITEKRLELKLEIPKNPIWLKGDPHQISKILISLISNAIKFTEYGTITVVVISEPSFVAQENVVIEFIIKDTGTGMLKEDISNLFQAFEQKKINTGKEYSGSGLGLLISKKTIELMGGTIKIESQKWEGTQVYFSIKCSYLNEQELFEAIKEKTIKDNALTRQTPDLSGKKILILEDNIINMTMLCSLLKPTNCICYQAFDGEQALQQFEQNRFDLIFTDIGLPTISGLEVAKLIREKELFLGYHTPIVVLSSFKKENLQYQKLNKKIIDDYLTKPYEKQKIFEVIYKHVLLKKMESAILVYDFEKQSRNLNSPEPEIAGSPSITVNILPDFSRMDLSDPLKTTFSNVSSPSKKTRKTLLQNKAKCLVS